MRSRLLPIYVAFSLVDAAASLGGRRRMRLFTKPLLMPLLIADARAQRGEPTDQRVLGGLALSWVGDVALIGRGDTAFGVGLGSFLAAHVAYIAALRERQASKPWARPLHLAYLVAWVILNALLLPRAGKLRVPVFVYGTALAAMASAAAETGSPAVAAGGAAFLISDSVLALEKFEAADIPAAGAIVMLTYTAAQALIASGLREKR